MCGRPRLGSNYPHLRIWLGSFGGYSVPWQTKFKLAGLVYRRVLVTESDPMTYWLGFALENREGDVAGTHNGLRCHGQAVVL